jgi:hypothetical protein
MKRNRPTVFASVISMLALALAACTSTGSGPEQAHQLNPHARVGAHLCQRQTVNGQTSVSGSMDIIATGFPPHTTLAAIVGGKTVSVGRWETSDSGSATTSIPCEDVFPAKSGQPKRVTVKGGGYEPELTDLPDL